MWMKLRDWEGVFDKLECCLEVSVGRWLSLSLISFVISSVWWCMSVCLLDYTQTLGVFALQTGTPISIEKAQAMRMLATKSTSCVGFGAVVIGLGLRCR